jgi:hypothetical protein
VKLADAAALESVVRVKGTVALRPEDQRRPVRINFIHRYWYIDINMDMVCEWNGLWNL